MTLGERIQQLRKQKGYSQEKLAEQLNMSRQAITKWEQNACEPNLESLVKMASLFEVSLDYLIVGTVPQKKTENTVTEQTIIIKEKNTLLNKNEILYLLVFIISTLCLIGLFVYALLNPIYREQSYSFIWWYFDFGSPSRTWFLVLNVAAVVGIVWSLMNFLKGKKGGNDEANSGKGS